MTGIVNDLTQLQDQVYWTHQYLLPGSAAMLLIDIIKRPGVLKRLIYIIPVLSLAALAFIFYWFSEARDNLAGTLMGTRIDAAELGLAQSMNPVVENLRILQGWGRSGVLDPRDVEGLNKQLVHVLQQITSIDSIILSDQRQLLYTLRRNDNGWITGFSESDEDGVVRFIQWTDWEKPIASWTEERDLDEEYGEMVSCVESNLDTDLICWFGSLGLGFEGKLPLMGMTGWSDGGDDVTYIVTATVRERDVIGRLMNSTSDMNARVIIINEQEGVFASLSSPSLPPLTLDLVSATDSESDEGETVYERAVHRWIHLMPDEKPLYRFRYGEHQWWCGFRPLPVMDGLVHVGILVPQYELFSATGQRRFPSLLIVAPIIVFSVLSVFLLRMAYRIRVRNLTTLESTVSYAADGLLQLLQAGESETLEFKSSLRWDIRRSQINKKLEEVVLKTIGAFNNSRGGTLLIGVDDDGTILGLQNDYNSLKKQGRDYFELHLRNIIGESYSIEYATRNITIAFPEVSGREICLVTVLRGDRPVYTNTVDKNGQRVERFYVRSGNSSRELEKPSDVVAYVHDRFKE
jgi:hypothetical protein